MSGVGIALTFLDSSIQEPSFKFLLSYLQTESVGPKPTSLCGGGDYQCGSHDDRLTSQLDGANRQRKLACRNRY